MSVYCRLGFAFRKDSETEDMVLHSSWQNTNILSPRRYDDVYNMSYDLLQNTCNFIATSSAIFSHSD